MLADQAGISGGIFGGMTLINVNSGSDYTQDAVALDNFATGTTLYTSGNNTSPTLQNADPATSVVIADFGLVFNSDWAVATTPGANAADPVSAVLMHDSIMNEFVLDAGTNSGTDWVVTMPTKRFYVGNGAGTPARLFQRNFDKTSGACDDISLDIHDREEGGTETGESIDFSPSGPGPSQFVLCWEASVITFNDSNVLGSANVSHLGTDFENGWLNVGFFPTTVTGAVHTLPNNTTFFFDPADPLTGASPPVPATYFGLPVVGFAVQSFANGAIDVGNGPVLSNYGGNFVHKGTRFVGGIFLP